MPNKKSIVFIIKEQESVFIQMRKNSLYWTLPTILINTNYSIFKGVNFITKKFGWINIKCASTILDSKIEYDGQTIETIFCEIITAKNSIDICGLSNNSAVSFQKFISLPELQVLANKTVYVKHYLNLISQKERKTVYV